VSYALAREPWSAGRKPPPQASLLNWAGSWLAGPAGSGAAHLSSRSRRQGLRYPSFEHWQPSWMWPCGHLSHSASDGPKPAAEIWPGAPIAWASQPCPPSPFRIERWLFPRCLSLSARDARLFAAGVAGLDRFRAQRQAPRLAALHRHDCRPVLEPFIAAPAAESGPGPKRLEQYPGLRTTGWLVPPAGSKPSRDGCCRQPLQRRSPLPGCCCLHWLSRKPGRSPASRTPAELCRQLANSSSLHLNLAGLARRGQAQPLLLLEQHPILSRFSIPTRRSFYTEWNSLQREPFQKVGLSLSER